MSKSPTATPAWRNRIVDSGVEDAEQLLANPFNARIHPKFQQQSLQGVLSEVGWVQRVIVNRLSGHVVDGHLRVALAISAGEQVPVDYVELTDEEEKLILATFDHITSLATYDKDQLNILLDDISTDNTSLQMLLSNLAEEYHVIPPTGSDTSDDMAEGTGGSDESDVRMVYLFLNAAQADDFSSMTKRLSEMYGLTTLTDTIFECVKQAYEHSSRD